MSTPYLGEVRLFPYTFAPVGWQACDGSLLDISTYEALYTLLGTTYGGNGVTTFGVPDLRGRVPVHQGQGTGLTARILGQVGGTEGVTLLSNQIPSHTHTFYATSSAAGSNAPGNTLQMGALGSDTMYTSEITGASISPGANTISTTVGNEPHDNLMPTLTGTYCIAVQGIWPSQG